MDLMLEKCNSCHFYNQLTVLYRLQILQQKHDKLCLSRTLLLTFNRVQNFPFDLCKFFLAEISEQSQCYFVHVLDYPSDNFWCEFFNLLTAAVNSLSNSGLNNTIHLFQNLIDYLWLALQVLSLPD